MATIEPIKVEGLREFQAAVRRAGGDLPRALRLGLNSAMDIVVEHARPRVPRKSGRAAASIKAQSTGNRARIKSGGNRAPYMPWLDFGGKVGRNRSVSRPFRKEGRYIWKSFADRRQDVISALETALTDVAKSAGLEVTTNGGN